MLKNLVLFSLIVFLMACKDKTETTKASKEDISESVYASGFIKSRNQYQVFSKVSGVIQKIHVHEGDDIKKGQALFTVSNEASKLNNDNARLAADNADYRANADKLSELQLTINLAKKKMSNDLLVLNRQKKLWADQIGTKFELEQRELAYANSKSAYESANLRYSELQKQLRFSSQQSKKNLLISRSQLNDFTVKSEVDGRLYNLLKEKGEMVSPQTAIAVIGEGNNFSLLLQVDENDIVKMIEGQKVFVSLDSYKGEVFEAVVDKINPYMNERSRSFEIEASFIKQPKILYPNLTVEANILLQQKNNAITIPRKFLIDDEYVMISKKEKRKVRLGLKDYQKAEVVEGLKEGEIIYMPSK